MVRPLVFSLFVALLFLTAGCGAAAPTTTAVPKAAAVPPKDTTFDGDRAYQWVLKQVYAPNGSMQPRTPGSVGSRAVAAIISQNLKESGWQVRQQTFSGRDYFGLDLAPVANYTAQCDSQMRKRVRDLLFTNIVASYGSGPTILLGAHYDSKRTASIDPDPGRRGDPVPGANDGASGVAVLLELGRLIPSLGLDRRVVLLFFDGEDGFEDCHPLAGSLFYAQHLSDQERRAVQVFILLDMVGDRQAVFAPESYSRESAPRWVDLLWKVAREQRSNHFVDSLGGGVTDDHVSFIQQGIPSVDIIDYRPGAGFPPTWHTAADLPEALSPNTLQEVGDVLLEILKRSLPE